MWILAALGGLFVWRYRSKILPGVFHGEYKAIAFIVSDNGPNVDGPSFRSKRVTTPSQGMAGTYQAAEKVAKEWYGADSRVEQIAGGPFSGPFSVKNSQGEWFLYVESVSE